MQEKQLFVAALGLALGMALGGAYFLALRANTRLYLGTGVGAALALHAVRLVGSTGAFLAIAVFAPAGLLPAVVGFTAAGLVASRRVTVERTP